MPVLEGAGIAQNSFLLAACALRTPHVHPNANGLLYVVNGEGMKRRVLCSWSSQDPPIEAECLPAVHW